MPPTASPPAPCKEDAENLIRIRGARQNNLKGFDLSLPLGRLIVLSGPSGSGKSSLAFDTLYAEGQRRYVETFSPYTRQFFDRMDKPAVDEIRGIPPAIAIEQVNAVKSTRSTVGSMTDLNDYLRLLLPHVVESFCPQCHQLVHPQSAASLVASLIASRASENDSPLLVAFPLSVPADAPAVEFLAFLQQQGYQRYWADGAVHRTDTPTASLPPKIHVIQDRLAPTRANQSRLSEAVETALRFGKGKLSIIDSSNLPRLCATGRHCPDCAVDLPEPTPGRFSFNHPLGACKACKGFGRIITLDLMRAIPDPSLSLEDGAIKPFQTESGSECQRDLLRAATKRGIPTRIPFSRLAETDRHWVLEGEASGLSGEELWKSGLWYGVRGYFSWLESKSYKMHVRVQLSRYRTYTVCSECAGGRFAPDSLVFRWRGRALPELMQLPVAQLHDFVSQELDRLASDATASLLAREVQSRLGYLRDVGLGYLTLDRPTRSLSGGETARVNLTTCLGTSLTGTLFVLDEPSIGLHPRDTGRLVQVLQRLRDAGNTLVVVEHEEMVIRAADHFVEIGPGSGLSGGHLVYSGPLQPVASGKVPTLTGDYLSGKKQVSTPRKRRIASRWIHLHGASANNLQNVDASFPLGVLACITGVSGSGKSTLVHQVLYRHLAQQKGESLEEPPGACRSLLGAELVHSVLLVDQSPLSRTPRSSPALYLGIFDSIRELFARTPEARSAGLTSSSFSFNSGNGRCERCSGCGFEKVEMQFLSDVFIRCPECHGRRYQEHTRRIRLGGKSIDEVLELTVTEAIPYLVSIECGGAVRALQTLVDVGLGYLRLGQPLNGLSGGESQRLKLVERLLSTAETNSLLILDEPTTGLHFDDITLLLSTLHRLVDAGHSVLVIEHNLEVIRSSDWIIDIGPDAGSEGGSIVACGTPEQISQIPHSHTGRFLSHSPAPTIAESTPAPFDAAPNRIAITGARHHNLKNLNLHIPRDAMVVVTGLSGSGKSSLAFDLLFAEGQRRFLDSMSPYARQFATQLERPDVDHVSGLPPTVAIEQRITRGGGKSTVATVTEVYHFLRLLFSKLGTQHCPDCREPVRRQTLEQAVSKTSDLQTKGKVRVLAPLIKARKGYHTEVARWATRQGFELLLVDGKWEHADRFPKLERFQEHTIEVLIGDSESNPDLRTLLQSAFHHGKGTVILLDSRNRRHVLSTERSCPSCGLSFEELDPRLFSFNSPHGWCLECHGFGEIWKCSSNPRLESALEIELDLERQHEALESGETRVCPGCNGSRLNPTARAVRLQNASIHETIAQTAAQTLRWIDSLQFEGPQSQIAADILPEITQRLRFLQKVGLEYLNLNRSAKTLSGGESQRIRLAAQLGSNLRGVLYVLDEPTIGLHPRDNAALLDTLQSLKTKGNSLLIVEHDEETLLRADHILDLGPGAGKHGGKIIAEGSLEDLRKSPHSATGACLRSPLQHPTRGERRPITSECSFLEVQGAQLHNLKSVRAKIPIGRLTVLTGISGSGKSTLMRGVLKPAVEAALQHAKSRKTADAKKPSNAPWRSLSGAEHLEAVYEVDQSPIGKTSRSTPATYLGIFDGIRALFAATPLARIRGYEPGRFSFNTEGGRCESCMGQGSLKVEMSFLPPAFIPCPECNGLRFNPSTLEVLFQGRSIAEVMNMPMEEAAQFFQAHAAIARPLRLLCETGLGYLCLGQPSQTLSGGEAQRLKLVHELTRGIGRSENLRLRKSRATRSVLYLLEEPTIGLHQADVRLLLGVLHRLVDEGHTVVVIEHHTSVIADADYLLEIGPEAGPAGGFVVASGPPEAILREKESRIAPFLIPLLSQSTLPGKPAPIAQHGVSTHSRPRQ
ncbi:MAG: excinuclease subunit UvrA [Verrucomicrobiota bacterium]